MAEVDRTGGAFTAYDLRGVVGAGVDADLFFRVARALVETLGARRIALGRDARLSSPELAEAAAEGAVAAGAEVLELGLCGTEEVYAAAGLAPADAGLMVTASHNPADWNGLKFVGGGAAPLSAEAFAELRARTAAAGSGPAKPGGRRVTAAGARATYIERVLSFVDPAALPEALVLVDAGHGAAGPTFDALAAALAERGARLRFQRRRYDPDGRFPDGAPNPLLPERRAATEAATRASGAELGVAWDGDFDRCFLFDHRGGFVPGEHMVALLAEAFLAVEPGATIVHDPRAVWSIEDAVVRSGGCAIATRTGHAFLKAALRETGAVYGGEMSAHHYFRDFFACDSGMIPWLVVLALMGRQGAQLADLVDPMRRAFPSSGERNFTTPDPAAAIARVRAALGPEARAEDRLDGLSLDFGDWRLNLRASNTEPLLRLNVEARGDAALVEAGVARVAALV